MRSSFLATSLAQCEILSDSSHVSNWRGDQSAVDLILPSFSKLVLRPQEEFERGVLAAHDRAFEAGVEDIFHTLGQEQRFLPKVWDAMGALNITGKDGNPWEGF